MSILDDAIREHLELKRAHGADDVELKKLEDEAFGPPQRPGEIDPFAEAPTEFLTGPSASAEEEPAIADEALPSGRRAPNIADLQEGPPPTPPPPPSADVAPAAPPTGEVEPAPASGAEAPAGPSDEEQPAGEVALPPHEPASPEGGHNTAERRAIAEQPTEMFDVQSELSGDTSTTEPTSPPSPSDEQLVDASQEEPGLTPVEPESAEFKIKGPDAEAAGHPQAEAAQETDEDEFFSEQRLSDELDQALEAPLTNEEELPVFEDAAPPTTDDFAPPATDEHARPITDDFAPPTTGEHTGPPTDDFVAPSTDEGALPFTDEHAVPTTEEGTAIFDIETDDDDYSDERSLGAAPLAPAPEPPTPAPEPRTPPPSHDPEPPADAEPRPDFDPDTGHEDVLEDTPDFLEGAPEDDSLWFEQKPPKDFDFDD